MARLIHTIEYKRKQSTDGMAEFLTFVYRVRIIPYTQAWRYNWMRHAILYVGGKLMLEEEAASSVKKNILTYAGLKNLKMNLMTQVNQRKAI